MDARSSRYHEVYARWQRDPQGFWGEAAAAIEVPSVSVRSTCRTVGTSCAATMAARLSSAFPMTGHRLWTSIHPRFRGRPAARAKYSLRVRPTADRDKS